MELVAEAAANKGLKLSGMYMLSQMLDNNGNDITGKLNSYIDFTWSTFRYVTDPLESDEKDYTGLYTVVDKTATFKFSGQTDTQTGQWDNGKLVIQESDDTLIFLKTNG